MLNYAMAFLVCGVIVWGLYWAGVPGVPLQVSWVLSAAGIILLMIYVVTGQKTRMERIFLGKSVPSAIRKRPRSYWHLV